MIRAPFPWFGGKALVADLIWSRLGHDVGTFAEPFAGSCAVALNRPAAFDGWITLNDLDGLICNFWRSMIAKPEEVAAAACSPTNECDLHARHLWLVNNKEALTARLLADPDYCDARAAGWWAWGCCIWIGGGWCAGSGPWNAVPSKDGIAEFRKSSNGQGVNRKLPHIGASPRGVMRQLPHIGASPRGVMRQLPHLGDNGRGEARVEWLNQWFSQLSDLLHSARVTCGSWERVCSPGTLTRNGVAGILMDPPYSLTDAVYAEDSSSVSADVRSWCLANGGNENLRIALCGHSGEGHEVLEGHGWECVAWKKHGGYQGADDRERIWFSPHCKKLEIGGLFA